MNDITCRTDNGVLHVMLDRPDKLNAVNTPLLTELAERIRGGADDSVRLVLLTGAGRAFCSGGDLSGRNTQGAGEAANDAVEAIISLPKPVVAGVHGPASGFGCSLALACDLVVATKSAYFQLAFAKVGLMPDGGASALISAAVGRQRAGRMAMLAERIPAQTAFDWGMISHVVDDDDYENELAEVVNRLATGPTSSYGWIKRALRASTLNLLPETQAIELQGQQQLVRSADFRAAAEAFKTRETPQFIGR